MSNFGEKSVVVTESAAQAQPMNQNVLTITRPSPTRQNNSGIAVLSTIHDCDSTRSMTPPQTPANEKSTIEVESSPYSFLQQSESKQNINVSHSGFDSDIEGLALQKTEACNSKSGLVAMKSKCSSANAWPNRIEQQKVEKKANKQKRARCTCWVGMTRKNRNIIKVAVLLVLIGLIIGLCLGVTKAVNGGVFHSS